MTILHTFWAMRRVGSFATAVALAVAFACMVGQAGGQKQPTAEAKSSRGVEARTAGQRIRKIEVTAVDIPMGEKEPVRLSLAQLMELYKVPGLSIAVIDDFKVVWAKGYGTIGAGSNAPVTPKTLFQAGSISKPVAATGALYLVEYGKLALDED